MCFNYFCIEILNLSSHFLFKRRETKLSNEFVKQLLKEINRNEALENKEIKITRFQFFRKSNLLKVVIRALEHLNNEEEEFIKKIISKNLGLNIDIQVDGGIDINNVEDVIKAGANIIVAGSAVYNGDTAANTKAMMEILNKYE